MEQQAADPTFWNDQDLAQEVLQHRRRLQEDFDLAESLGNRSEDLAVLIEWAAQGEEVVDDLVVHRAAELRVRMQDDRDGRALLLRRLVATLQATRRTSKNNLRHKKLQSPRNSIRPAGSTLGQP